MAVDVTTYPTVLHVLQDRAKRWKDRPAARFKELGLWHTISWGSYFEDISKASASINALGLQAGCGAAILSENRPEWMIADFASMCNRLMSNGLYTTSSVDQIAYQLEDSNSQLLFVDGGELLEKVLALPVKLQQKIKRIVIFDMTGLDNLSNPVCESWDGFLQRGEVCLAKNRNLPDELIENLDGETIAMLIYTSGTTGSPKGAMISHSNIMAQLRSWQRNMPLSGADRSICFLPLCHVAERMFSGMSPVAVGSVVHYAESAEAFAENLREVRPTILFAPPRVFEKLSASVDLMMAEARPSSQGFYEIGKSWITKQTGPFSCVQKWMAKNILLRNILRVMGFTEMKMCIAGAAPVSDQLIDWYRDHGIAIYELFGMTETCGAQTRIVFDGNHQYCGVVTDIGEMKIGIDGEVLARGPHVFQGYLNNPAGTADALDDEGWLHTGDEGQIDGDGNLRITGRIKDIMITSGGKNISPSKVESRLKTSPYIVDAMLVGDGRKYITGLVMVDQDTVSRYARDNGVPFTDFADLCRKKEIISLIGREVESVNKSISPVEQVKKFRILDIELDAEDEELTPTMKLKRSKIEEKYEIQINSMYG